MSDALSVAREFWAFIDSGEVLNREIALANLISSVRRECLNPTMLRQAADNDGNDVVVPYGCEHGLETIRASSPKADTTSGAVGNCNE